MRRLPAQQRLARLLRGDVGEDVVVRVVHERGGGCRSRAASGARRAACRGSAGRSGGSSSSPWRSRSRRSCGSTRNGNARPRTSSKAPPSLRASRRCSGRTCRLSTLDGDPDHSRRRGCRGRSRPPSPSRPAPSAQLSALALFIIATRSFLSVVLSRAISRAGRREAAGRDGSASVGDGSGRDGVRESRAPGSCGSGGGVGRSGRVGQRGQREVGDRQRDGTGTGVEGTGIVGQRRRRGQVGRGSGSEGSARSGIGSETDRRRERGRRGSCGSGGNVHRLTAAPSRRWRAPVGGSGVGSAARSGPTAVGCVCSRNSASSRSPSTAGDAGARRRSRPSRRRSRPRSPTTCTAVVPVIFTLPSRISIREPPLLDRRDPLVVERDQVALLARQLTSPLSAFRYRYEPVVVRGEDAPVLVDRDERVALWRTTIFSLPCSSLSSTCARTACARPARRCGLAGLRRHRPLRVPRADPERVARVAGLELDPDRWRPDRRHEEVPGREARAGPDAQVRAGRPTGP